MKDLKYRAWDNNTMVYEEDTPAGKFKNEPAHVRLGRFFSSLSNKAILMDFTGKLARNNFKEIYHGDIVRYVDEFKGIDELCEIGYQDCAFTVITSDGIDLLHLLSPYVEDVVGNIFETPKLLRKIRHEQVQARG